MITQKVYLFNFQLILTYCLNIERLYSILSKKTIYDFFEHQKNIFSIKIKKRDILCDLFQSSILSYSLGKTKKDNTLV